MDRSSLQPTTAVFDAEDLLARCLGKIDLAERVLARFCSRFDVDLAELERAVRVEDTDQIARVAHRLKGASATVAATGLASGAARIEELARCGAMPEIPKRVEELRSEWTRFAGCAALAGEPAQRAC
jgi:HPt (histidine-containing phosphotransfer) domain-containing protein